MDRLQVVDGQVEDEHGPHEERTFIVHPFDSDRLERAQLARVADGARKVGEWHWRRHVDDVDGLVVDALDLRLEDGRAGGDDHDSWISIVLVEL